jgi:hypothetical protein
MKLFHILFIIIFNINISYAQELILSKEINEFNINTADNSKKDCMYKSIKKLSTVMDEKIKFYVDDSINWFSTIKEVKSKQNKLIISFIQKLELKEYEVPLTLIHYEIYDSEISNDPDEIMCIKNLRSYKIIDTNLKKPTGNIQWFDKPRGEKLIITGFGNIIKISDNDKMWSNSSRIEIDITSYLKQNKKAENPFYITVRCSSCPNTKIIANGKQFNAINEFETLVDYRFVKTQIDNGLFQ